MIRFGFQRLVLLSSAGYQRAELPLDDSVSLIAPNNTGKTSLINALQFLLIIDQRRMDFGAHEWSKTRRFYFPHNSAYVLLEVSLPQTGTVVLGCVGKGVSHDYEYFAYKGELITEDYRLPTGTIVQQPQLLSHLASKGYTAYRYDASDFAKLIYGGIQSRRGNEPDFTVFKLEQSNYARVFQQVLTRTLRLERLTSAEVKAYLLQIFQRDLADARIDFKQEWDKAFHDVNIDRAQYDAASNQLDFILALEETYNELLQLRGKLIDWRPRIDNGLMDWQQHYEDQLEQLQAQKNELTARQDAQQQRTIDLAHAKFEAQQKLKQLNSESRDQHALETRFALIKSVDELELQRCGIKRELDELTAVLSQADKRSSKSISQALAEQKQRLQRLQQQQKHLDNNLYQQLAKQFPSIELDRMNKLLNSEVMMLSPEDYRVDPARLQAALNTDDEWVELAGLELSTQSLNAQYAELSAAELDEQIADSAQQLEHLAQQLEASHALSASRDKKARLEDEVRQLEEDIQAYGRLGTLQLQAVEREQTILTLTEDLERVEQEIANTGQRAQQLRDQLFRVDQQCDQLERDHKSISTLRNNRADAVSEFGYLDSLAHHSWIEESPWSLDRLAERLQTYQQDCKKLLEMGLGIETSLQRIHTGGLTRYMNSESQDHQPKRMFEFCHNLPQEREALEKKARSAVVNVTASLRQLREGLWTFQNRMREFNRLIGRRQLSDLKTFKIEAMDESHLVEAITVLIEKSELVEGGDSFELFNQTSVLDDERLDRAKQTLIDEGNARRGLRVSDLFRLVFVVAKTDQSAETFQDIDSAASNGTVLMAKLVTGLAMLHLMQDKRHNLHAVCYLDEALALDGRNQTSLIATAHEFGFALIFASPAPLVTARYCVPIHQHLGANHISRESWQRLQPLQMAEVETEK